MEMNGVSKFEVVDLDPVEPFSIIMMLWKLYYA